MSVAFEYGGIDREPVSWADRGQSASCAVEDSVDKSFSSNEERDVLTPLDINLMLITQ
jgi:hypothetical protein